MRIDSVVPFSNVTFDSERSQRTDRLKELIDRPANRVIDQLEPPSDGSLGTEQKPTPPKLGSSWTWRAQIDRLSRGGPRGGVMKRVAIAIDWKGDKGLFLGKRVKLRWNSGLSARFDSRRGERGGRG
ncbi:hypothetical protein TNIN_316401 [Trichonephila inaurata madagascariensis]|uniref:Uncharacterized protein n=1 Tax=Trichonephila inaurata madagascariensis TaxID=2747483 RepID=A0A8X6MLU9_9ARAC|nr:hypothetical protein TNIN_316401 [Trichonephila inaurata madagascariensis]